MSTSPRLASRALAWIAFAVIVPASLRGQVAQGSVAVQVPVGSFTPLTSAMTYDVDFLSNARLATGPNPGSSLTTLVSGVTIPNGAVLDRIDFEVYDNDPDHRIMAELFTCPALGPCNLPFIVSTDVQPGWTNLSMNPIRYVIDNVNYSYPIHVVLTADAGLQLFRRAVVYYHLQVAPAPAVATFLDVPTDNPYFQFVEALAASGITVGCGGGNFCPDSPLSRGQLAVFLAKALGLYWPPAQPN